MTSFDDDSTRSYSVSQEVDAALHILETNGISQAWLTQIHIRSRVLERTCTFKTPQSTQARHRSQTPTCTHRHTHREPPTSTHCPDSLRHCGKIGSDPSWAMLEIILWKTSRLFCRMFSLAAFLIRSACPRVIPIDCTTAARACADRACAESLLYFGKHVQRYTLVKKEFETRTL